MADNWGNCQNCRFFASESDHPDVDEEANCQQPELKRFELLVTGASGCNAFQLRPGLAREVSAHPPLHQ